ncbi:MFS transporter [Catellatospora tritici]|uniref:MFS transporter n=1 Tax=Catellatospora tritici TaxID=2851566 RepID=UPI001C2D9353|nr:MFS transporter [Catellatospora tritici]MBV1852561.1 MFS transporter [Catellatospora tritici]
MASTTTFASTDSPRTSATPNDPQGTGDVADPARWTPRLWGTLLVLCAVLFLDGLDISMVGVALPAIQSDLGLSTASLQWIVSGYVLGYGGLLLLGGRTADLLGRRRVLLVALAVFAGASVLGGLVDNSALLIASRFVKGLAAAFTAPAGLSILTTTFPEGPVRNRALGIYTVFGASGFSSGLILGGLLTEIDWRVTFLLPAPLALIALVAGIKLIPKNQHRAQGRQDLLGAATSTAALLLLVYTVVNAPAAGWLSIRTLGSLLLVAALAAAFLSIERRVAHPLVRLGIFTNRTLVRANLTAMAVSGGYLSFQFVFGLYLQRVLGWSPLQMALSLLPTGLIVATSGSVAGALITRYGTRRLIAWGMLAFVAAYALFLRADAQPDVATVILPTALLLGAGFALTFSALNVQATSGIADDEQGLASGLVQTSLQVGGAIALAATTAVVGGDRIVAGHLPGTFQAAIGLVTVISLLGLLAAVLRGRTADRTEAEAV